MIQSIGLNSRTTLALVLTLSMLAACEGVENDRIVEESGGYKLIVSNGVCIEVDETGDDDEPPLTRVNPVRCGL